MRLKTKLLCALAIPLLAQTPTAAHAQWTHRYPKLANVTHHVYLEGYNLPTMAQSPTDPAVSPDSKTVAFSARGWIWTMDVGTRQARRLTKGKDMDFRPAWSPDGRQIAFVRDNTSDTTIMMVDVASQQERTLVDTKGMDLDPAFSPDGKTLFYSSAEAGDLDIWRMDLASGAKTRLTTDRGQELNPQPINGGTGVAFVAKSRGDAVETLSLDGKGERKTLLSDSLVPQMRIAASPDGRSVAAVVLDGDRWKIVEIASRGGDTVRIAADATAPEAPNWSSAGDVWFVQPNADKQFDLYRVSDTGGPIEDMTPLAWDLGEPTARVTIRTRQGAQSVAARLMVVDGQGHPVAPEKGIARFDQQHGVVFFHSAGAVTLNAPAGTLKVIGTHGFDGVAEVTRTVAAGQDVVIDLDLPTTGFNAQARGWYSADLHNHLNYGGPYQLVPTDLIDEMKAEDLDVATPMLANLNTTLVDTRYAHWQHTTLPLIQFSQEVRPNIGHVGLVAVDQLFTPWFYGASSPGYSQDNLTNGDPLKFARDHGGLAVYVHPVTKPNPFPADGAPPTDLPTAMVADAVLGSVDTIEVACLWSDELGTADAWYRFLNLGLPITATAGSDTMHNFYRMMAIGATRVYARPEGALNMKSYVDALRQGRSFVSSGPQLDFTVAGVGPGGVVTKGGQVEWKLDAYSAVAVQKVEVLVNGKVVWRGDGLSAPGKRTYGGKISVPAGGWVAARVYGGPPAWPSQESYPFAHTSAIWFKRVGSTDPAAVRAAASDLLRALDSAEGRMKTSYPGDTGQRQKQRLVDARKLLVSAKASGVFQRP
jgi:TolB protein